MKNKNIEYLVGCKDSAILSSLAFGIYDSKIIDFLSELSNQILLIAKSNNNYRIFSYYALWSRKSNLLRLRNERNDLNHRFGRGLAFHIAPSNVASNILFTLAFGLLSGCPSIIRISKKNIDEIKEILKVINNILKESKYQYLKNFISIISYERDEEINKKLSYLSDLRIIWGGDKTIDYFKEFKTKPKSIDIVFPNRSSISIISKNWLSNASEENKKWAAKSFSNDIALFSQRACSSPKQIFLLDINNDINESRNLLNKFLKDCDHNISLLNELEDIYSLRNFKAACELSAKIKEELKTIKYRNLFGIYTNICSNNFDDLNFENSCFLIRNIKTIKEVNEFIRDDNQTIVQIGLSKEEIYELVRISCPRGTDRIVKAGKALNMDIFWDGYDTVGIMSRIVQFSKNE